MHRAAFALGATRGLAVELGHASIHRHASHERMAVVAITRDVVVVLSRYGKCTDGNRFLSDVEVEEAADLPLLIGADAALLKMANARHLGVEVNFVLFCQGSIDRIFSEGRRARGALQGLRMGKGDGLGHGDKAWIGRC